MLNFNGNDFLSPCQTLLTAVQQLKSLADNILDSHADFENKCTDNNNKISSGLSVAGEKSDRLARESSIITDLQQMRGEHLSAYEARTEDLLKKVSTSRDTVCIISVQDSEPLSNFCVAFFSPVPLSCKVNIICLIKI
jgi:hypothetical protein